MQKRQEKYGDLFKMRFLGDDVICIMGQNSTKHFLVKNGDALSSEAGWEHSAGNFFPNGLMLLDGERHKIHRNIMREAFTKQAIEGYIPMMEEIAERFVENLKGTALIWAFEEIKTLTLEMAMKMFFGLERSPVLDQVNQAFTDVVAGATSIPINLPWTVYGKGKRSRAYLEQFFRELIPQTRKQPGKDLLSILVSATDEEGNRLTDEEIIDHSIFLLMAAHDTTASTLTSMFYFAGKHPEWQGRMRKEVDLFPSYLGMDLTNMQHFENIGLVMKETMRMIPAVMVIPRVATEDIPFGDYVITKGQRMNIAVRNNHYDPQVFDQPDTFDPERFAKPREEDRQCPFHYSPFGAGKHYCLGYSVAEVQVKIVMRAFLKEFDWELEPGYKLKLKDVPIPHPKDALPVILKVRKTASY